ncbi:hypothetical protein [Aridibaculum aurantiacum]|uniref:hypothetical protein n=1 Tax=Aridibaculum aurantiacum TaxID=2810307 RepID=UPI001A96A9AD|nr:hypothetical protein [Aridibaculum aurantiacum]
MRRFVYLLCILFVFSCSQPAGEAYDLQLLLKKGEQFDLTVSNTVKTEDESVDYESRLLFTVDSVSADKSKYLLTLKVDYIQLESKGMFGDKVKYHSNRSSSSMNEQQQLMHQAFKPVLDSSLQISIDKYGRLVKPYAYKSNIRLPKGTDPVDIQVCFLPLAGKPVAVGEEWQSERTNEVTGGKVHSTYSITNIKNEVVRISYNGIVKGVPGYGKDSEVYGYYQLNKSTGKVEMADMEMEVSTRFGGEGKMRMLVH